MKDNKFLTGFLIVTLVGAGALGFLLFQAKGKYSDASAAYSDKVGELQNLQNGKPYPDDSNYKKVLELQKNHQQLINDLQKQLSGAEIAVEPISPEKFQDNLREAIKRVRALAAQKGVKIGDKEGGNDKFSLGFELYETQPPKPEAAPQLGRMLKSIEFAVTELINSGPAKITSDVKRSPLPEEEGAQAKQPTAPAKPAQPAQPGAKKTVEEPPLVKRYPFEVHFVGREQAMRSFINNIVSNKQQFMIPASVKVANLVPIGPSKNAGAAAAAPAPTADPAPPAPTTPDAAPAPAQSAEASKFIVGEEQLEVDVRIEVVDFAEPAADKAGDKAAKPTKPAPAK